MRWASLCRRAAQAALNKAEQKSIRKALQHSAKMSLGDPLQFVRTKFKQAQGGTRGALNSFRLACKDRHGVTMDILNREQFKFCLAQCQVSCDEVETQLWERLNRNGNVDPHDFYALFPQEEAGGGNFEVQVDWQKERALA